MRAFAEFSSAATALLDNPLTASAITETTREKINNLANELGRDVGNANLFPAQPGAYRRGAMPTDGIDHYINTHRGNEYETVMGFLRSVVDAATDVNARKTVSPTVVSQINKYLPAAVKADQEIAGVVSEIKRNTNLAQKLSEHGVNI